MSYKIYIAVIANIEKSRQLCINIKVLNIKTKPMTNRIYIIILLLISILGFSFSFYTKYMKNYVQGVEKVEKSIDNETTLKQLNLSENITFIEKIEKTKDSIDISKVKGDKNKEAIKSLKTINIFCIVGMTLFTLLFISLIMRLKNSKKRVLMTNK